MLRSTILKLIALFIAFTFCGQSKARQAEQLQFAVPFTDHMVLQQQAEVPVWGFDSPGTKVTVKFAGQTKSTTADKFGDWIVKLDPLVASHESRSLFVSNDRDASVELKDVLVGEVWFSSGQSNMVWTAGKSMCNELARNISASDTDIPIREISIDTVSALYPQKKATSEHGWKTHKSAGNFSALSLSFAHELYKELDVPIGILLSAHSNTRIEAFTSRQAFEAHPLLEKDTQLIQTADPLTVVGSKSYRKYENDLREWQTQAALAASASAKMPSRPPLPGIAGMWRGPSQFYNGKIHPVVPFAIRGAIWCQGTSNSSDGRIYAARMEALIRGWRVAWKKPDLPFYFTQMQCYGSPDSKNVGFADIRQAQHQFFINNRDNTGMVVQTDLNSARPQGIHYFNKLHPGMRMARWALAHQYDKPIAFTGPIYSGYKVESNRVVVTFEKESLFGGLMVGSKGSAKDYRDAGKYVEPAQPTPEDSLNHFQLCGPDKKWHEAEAKISGDTVVVTSKNVTAPIGVQYAYSAVPLNSNLYNRAGLPATPFAEIDGKPIFEEDDPEKVAALKAKYAQYTDPDFQFLQVVEYFRDGAIIQRDKSISVWGHANQGVEVTVTLGDETRTATANKFQQWSVEFPPLSASTKPISLTVKSSHGHSRTVKDILVGDVWYLTGSTRLNGEMAYDSRQKDVSAPSPLPSVREFRRKTKASTFPTPRKRKFETGGGKYRSSWQPADFSQPERGASMFAYHFAKTLDRGSVPQGFITMSSGHGGRSPQMSSPLSWTSFDGVRHIQDARFRDRLDQLFLQYPNTEVAKKAVEDHLTDVKAFTQSIFEAQRDGSDLSQVARLAGPVFPEAGRNRGFKSDTIPTYSYNWCVSPMTPMRVAGVIWVPAEYNIGYDASEYAAELETYAKSLPGTFGQANIPFIFAQPTSKLVNGIDVPNINNPNMITFDEWPSSLRELAIEMARKVK